MRPLGIYSETFSLVAPGLLSGSWTSHFENSSFINHLWALDNLDSHIVHNVLHDVSKWVEQACICRQQDRGALRMAQEAVPQQIGRARVHRVCYVRNIFLSNILYFKGSEINIKSAWDFGFLDTEISLWNVVKLCIEFFFKPVWRKRGLLKDNVLFS